MRVSPMLLPLLAMVLCCAARHGNAQPIVSVAGAPLGTGAEGTLEIGGAAGLQLAQVFTAGMSRKVTQVRLPVACEPGSDLRLEIRTARSRGPDEVVLSSMTVSGSTLPPLTTPMLRILRLPQPVNLGETGEYAIVLQSPGTCTVLRGPAGPTFDFALFTASPPNPNAWQCLVCELPFEEQFNLPFLVIGEDLSLPPGLGGLPEAAGDASWFAAATEGQVVGTRPSRITARNNVVAALWFNDFADVATLQFAEQGGTQGSRVTLRCAPAGADGPALWSASDQDLSGAAFSLLTRDLRVTTPSNGCPLTVTNVAGLRAAAHARLLYLEIERDGLPLVRGQLWPRSISSPGISVTAGASAQQVVGTEQLAPRWLRGTTTLYFSDLDQFELVGFSVPYRQRYRSVELRCGVPGENGELVALLPFAQGVLSHDELIPVGPAGACGVAITTLASLLEALLRGELYVAIDLIDPPGVQLRGQFPSPYGQSL